MIVIITTSYRYLLFDFKSVSLLSSHITSCYSYCYSYCYSNGTARDALVVPKGIILYYMGGMLVGMKERKIFNRKNLKSKL